MQASKIALWIATAASLSVLALLIFSTYRQPLPVACTMEAKICPDGSAVGRQGPRCEFAECPGDTSGQMRSTVETGLNTSVSTLGVTITPLEIVEDSRCPIDVQCIWAGTVKVRALLESGLGTATQLFELNMPITTEAEIVTLISVAPEKMASDTDASAYRFTFEVAKRPTQ